ncbi:MAG TPA: lipopolysaccharide heptosyltransferase I [Geobacteraceae bacterium]
MRIAIVRLSSLGDIVFGMAALQVIRGRFPQAKITWVTDQRFAALLDHQPDVDEVVRLDLKGLSKRFSLARLRTARVALSMVSGCDIAIDLHGLIKSALIAQKLAPVRCGFHRTVVKEPLATLCYSRTFQVSYELPAVERYLQLVARSLDFDYSPGAVDAKEPFLCHAPEDCAVTKGFFQANRKNVIMVPETSIAYKNYPKEKLVEVANHLRENILVCHGSADELAAARYLAANSRYVTLLPHLDLNQLKAAIGQADLVIGGDTGPTHMAWAMNVPSLALFGATAPPYRGTDRHRLLVSASVANPRKPDKNDLSVADIPVTEVVRQAQELLNPTCTRST